MEKIDIIFEKVKNGRITPDEARMQIFFLFGNIKRSQKWLYIFGYIFGLCSGLLIAAIYFHLLI